MQLVSSAAQMQRYDRLAITKYRIPGLLLMENAGRAFTDALEKWCGPLQGKHVVVVCGKGNNGGDGCVVARHLANRGSSVGVVLLGKRNEVRGDARMNLDAIIRLSRAKNSGISFREVPATARTFPRLETPDIVVDAIFGTGFSGNVRGIARSAIRWINARHALVAAVDVPSGVDATTGIVANVSVRAHLTVTMGLGKIGHYVGHGRESSGQVEIADISIPRFLFSPGPRPVYRVHPKDVARALPVRPLTAHKHSVGKIFVLAGSRNLTGAPTMTSQAAMRSGAGAVILGVPKSIYGLLVRKVTEVMVTPLAETFEGSVSRAGWDEIAARVRWADVVVVGPGLSTNRETQQVILNLVSHCTKPLVVDADGLNAIALRPGVLKRRKAPTVLTPHVGELSRITGEDAVAIESGRVEKACAAARLLKSTLVLKGAPTVTGSPSGVSYLNSTGNPGMATAGSGDVLTGVLASFLGQGMNPDEAAYSAVLVHGLAGDMAGRLLGERGVMATDILRQIPYAIRLIEKAGSNSQ